MALVLSLDIIGGWEIKIANPSRIGYDSKLQDEVVLGGNEPKATGYDVCGSEVIGFNEHTIEPIKASHLSINRGRTKLKSYMYSYRD
jgi:hypothetical protein